MLLDTYGRKLGRCVSFISSNPCTFRVTPVLKHSLGRGAYRGTSLARKRTPQGPYRRPVPRVPRGSKGGGRFHMGEVPLFVAGVLLVA